jgi:hypothetical protein
VGLAEPTVDASAPSVVDEGLEAPPPQPIETANSPAPIAEAGVSKAIIREETPLPPRPVAADTESVEVRIPHEPAAAVQGPVAPEMATRAASPEIQEVEEAGASLSQGVAGDEARTLKLARVSWAASSELDTDSEDDEEVVVRNTMERGMTWARRAFDELILPATLVSFLVRRVTSQSRDLLGLRHLSLSCRLQVLESSSRRHAREVRKLHAERTQLEMQLIVAQVATVGVVAIEVSTRASLEAARASAEDRAIAAETAATTAATERDSLASKLALAEAEVERLRAAPTSRRRRLREPSLLRLRWRQPPVTPPKPLLARSRPLRRRCRSWRVTCARPRRTWRRQDAHSPRSRTSFKWQPRKWRDLKIPTRSCRMTLTVHWVFPPPLTSSALTLCRSLTRCSWLQGYACSAREW